MVAMKTVIRARTTPVSTRHPGGSAIASHCSTSEMVAASGKVNDQNTNEKCSLR
jgi:hypothetical protein